MGRLIAIEGIDGSGKETQTRLLFARLAAEGWNPMAVSFPDYESEASCIVKMYLAGRFGERAEDVDAKTASTFFAIDRYVSYKTKWEQAYKAGRVILADRYVTSNMIHQAGKLATVAEKDEFLDWLCSFEYGVYGLPEPDAVIFLDVPPQVGAAITKSRKNKATGQAEKDIHERDEGHIQKSYDNAKYIAGKYGWQVVNCAPGGALRSVEDIGEEVYQIVRGKLGD